MLSVAREMITEPRLMLVDEPTVGLAPNLADQVYELLQTVRKSTSTAILLVDQNVADALRHTEDVVMMNLGKVKAAGPCRSSARRVSMRWCRSACWDDRAFLSDLPPFGDRHPGGGGAAAVRAADRQRLRRARAHGLASTTSSSRRAGTCWRAIPASSRSRITPSPRSAPIRRACWAITGASRPGSAFRRAPCWPAPWGTGSAGWCCACARSISPSPPGPSPRRCMST